MLRRRATPPRQDRARMLVGAALVLAGRVGALYHIIRPTNHSAESGFERSQSERFAMSGSNGQEMLDLAALLCSRVCHDLISPVGAVVNGLEVLEEEDSDEETKTFALDLIKRSAKTASARLQFCRLAFGSAGAPGGKIDIGHAGARA